MSIKTILVPTDFSEHSQRAFEQACDLASQLGSKVYLLCVQTENALRTAIKEGLMDGASTDDELRIAVEQLIAQRFSQTICAANHDHSSIERVTKRGDPSAVITAYATEIGADLIVIGRRGSGLMHEVRASVLGSVTESVIRKSLCPVMVIRREHKVGV